jgi:hypothetical protein
LIKQDKENTYLASLALEKQLDSLKKETAQKQVELTEALEATKNLNSQLTAKTVRAQAEKRLIL